ncbi:signal peptidase II [Hydrogenophaga sp.]|uniref:signal peptidase II n=1 Tax=Hydrogenophaga sp. TaxID=1904254 RepID=UPI002FC9ECF2
MNEWLNSVHVRNAGAAFSFLADVGGRQRWLFIGVTLLVVGVVSVVCLAQQAKPMDRWLGAFVVGGGSGNIVESVQIGAVLDFLDLYLGNIHWPVFHLADVFIVCSALVWCFASMKSPPRASPINTPEELPT